jgi:hypothetical protein
MTKTPLRRRLVEAEDCVVRAHNALLGAWMALEYEDPHYYQVKELVDEVGGLRYRMTVSLQKTARK